MSLADATRAELRALMRVKKTRADGTTSTKPSLGQRRALNRKTNAVAKAARKINRG